MGNSSSRRPPSTSDIQNHPKRKLSTVFPQISISWASINPSSTYTFQRSQETPPSKEKPLLDVEQESPLTLQTQVAYSPLAVTRETEAESAFQTFLRSYPEYRLTWILDTLRRTDYSRLDRAGETYVDFMGGALYPESLVRAHTEFLNRSVLGNTHSVSNSSKLSLAYANEARAAVLSYFQASADYTVVFTANTSAALKLVGEAYQFTGGSNLVIGTDSHNSVHGIREYASYRGAKTCYIPCTSQGGLDNPIAKNILLRSRPRCRDLAPSLCVLTGQSNITNAKIPLSLCDYASSLGYHVVLDAAALAPTSVLSLAEHPVDAIAISFYKMFGYPTGVGALVIKKEFLAQLKRPWFAGGTVDVVQVPGNIVTRSREIYEQFEDGTINYLTLPSITDGLRFLSAYLPFLPLRLTSLLLYLASSLEGLRHDTTSKPVVKILSKVPSRRLRFIGDQSETGAVLALLFYGPSGELIPNSFIEYAASKQNISLRTGCMCNPGGAAALLGIQSEMEQLYPGVTLADFEQRMGRELGVVRISLGLASNFEDVWRVVQFAKGISQEHSRQQLWAQWMQSQVSTIGQAV